MSLEPPWVHRACHGVGHNGGRDYAGGVAQTISPGLSQGWRGQHQHTHLFMGWSRTWTMSRTIHGHMYHGCA